MGDDGPAKFAEDLAVGTIIDLGTYSVTHGEIIAFATQWDPLPFHIDQAAAESGYFGGLIASGIHSLAIFQRLAALGAYRHWSIIAGRALRNVELRRPVRPGITLSGSIRIDAVTPTRPGRSAVTTTGLLTAAGETVLSSVTDSIVRNRPEV